MEKEQDKNKKLKKEKKRLHRSRPSRQQSPYERSRGNSHAPEVQQIHDEVKYGGDAGEPRRAEALEDHDAKPEPRLFTQAELDEVVKERDSIFRDWENSMEELRVLKDANANFQAWRKQDEADKKILTEKNQDLTDENMV